MCIKVALDWFPADKQAREEAGLLLERKLLRTAGDVQSTLSQLQGMYLKEEDMESARFLADTGRKIVYGK